MRGSGKRENGGLFEIAMRSSEHKGNLNCFIFKAFGHLECWISQALESVCLWTKGPNCTPFVQEIMLRECEIFSEFFQNEFLRRWVLTVLIVCRIKPNWRWADATTFIKKETSLAGRGLYRTTAKDWSLIWNINPNFHDDGSLQLKLHYNVGIQFSTSIS